MDNMTIPFRVKLLTETAKAPERVNEGDLFDLFVDSFCDENLQDVDGESIYLEFGTSNSFLRNTLIDGEECKLNPQGRILVKTGIAIELPILTDQYMINENSSSSDLEYKWRFSKFKPHFTPAQYAVADIRPRSGLALKHGLTVLNTPGTIDNSYRKEIGVILYNAGHEPYTIKKGDKIAQMLIRPLYPSSFEVVEDFEDTGRGGYGSTGK